MNTWNAATNNVPRDVRQRLIAEGKLSELSVINPFSPLVRFPMEYRCRETLASVNAFYNSLFYGRIPCDVSQTGILPFNLIPGYRVHILLILGLPAVLLYGLLVSLKNQSNKAILDPRQRAVVLYLCIAITFVALVGNLLETRENNRFRFTTDPLSVVLLGLFAQHTVVPRLSRAWKRWHSSDAKRKGKSLNAITQAIGDDRFPRLSLSNRSHPRKARA